MALVGYLVIHSLVLVRVSSNSNCYFLLAYFHFVVVVYTVNDVNVVVADGGFDYCYCPSSSFFEFYILAVVNERRTPSYCYFSVVAFEDYSINNNEDVGDHHHPRK